MLRPKNERRYVIVAARSDICNMTHLAPAGTGGCYVGAPPRPRCAIYGSCGVH